MKTLSLLVAAALFAAASFAAPGGAAANDVRLEAELGQASIMVERKKRIYLRIGLEGLAPASTGTRTPVNVALVVDRSGSMEDENKIGAAREAALMGLGRLGRDDIAAVVAYNHEVEVLLPATRLLDLSEITGSIGRLTADGNTALYAGTEQGLQEALKFLDRGRVNRVILISDGLANVGPSSPQEVAELGRRAAAKGISITTIGLGLGYNEDLMAKLAYASDGNHAFVERADQLVKIFDREFGDVLSVVAQELIIKIDCHDGFKPLRALGREAEIKGSTITARLNQLYGKQQKYIVVELEVPEGARLGTLPVADVEVSYMNLATRSQASVKTTVSATLTDRKDVEEASLNKAVMADVTTQIANEVNEQAVELRDKGDIVQARSLLEGNAAYLKREAGRLAAPALESMAGAVASDAAALDDEAAWGKTRKAMRANQHNLKTQQSY